MKLALCKYAIITITVIIIIISIIIIIISISQRKWIQSYDHANSKLFALFVEFFEHAHELTYYNQLTHVFI